MRRVIAALQVSVDGFIEGPNGELDWVDTWEDPFDLSRQIDACVLGAGCTPVTSRTGGLSSPTPKTSCRSPAGSRLPARSRRGRFADRTPHFVLSTTLESVEWPTARIIRSVDEIRLMKQQPGKDIHAVGGATLVSSLMNSDLVDEIRLVVQPVVLGSGKALFKDVNRRHALELTDVGPIASGSGRLDLQAAPGRRVTTS